MHKNRKTEEKSDARKEYEYRKLVELIYLKTGKLVLTMLDVTEILGISSSSLTSYIKAGTAPAHIKRTGKVLFSITAVAGWIFEEDIPDYILDLEGMLFNVNKNVSRHENNHFLEYVQLHQTREKKEKKKVS